MTNPLKRAHRRIALAGLLILLLGATAVRAADKGPCLVRDDCATSHAEPYGLAWDGVDLWIGYGNNDTTIRRVAPDGCTLLGSIDSPNSWVLGLAWDGTALWASTEHSGHLYRLDPATGAVLAEIPAPSPQDSHGAAGLAWDGTHLWHADYRLRSLFRIDPSDGTVLDTFYLDVYVSGLAYRASDGMLIVSDFEGDRILTVDPSDGTIVDECDAPGTKPWGVALMGDEVRVADTDAGRLHDLGILTEVRDERWTWGQVRACYR